MDVISSLTYCFCGTTLSGTLAATVGGKNGVERHKEVAEKLENCDDPKAEKRYKDILKQDRINAATTLVTGGSSTFSTAYALTQQYTHRSAAAYIESLDDNQLIALEKALEEKSSILNNYSVENESTNVNTKKL